MLDVKKFVFFFGFLSKRKNQGEDALGKIVDARTPGLLSLSLAPAEDMAPMVTDDYTLASFYSTWRRSQLKMMHFFGPGVAKLTLASPEESEESREHFIEAFEKFFVFLGGIVLLEPCLGSQVVEVFTWWFLYTFETLQVITSLDVATYHCQANTNTVVIFRPSLLNLTCRTDEETMILSASFLEHMDSLYLTGNEIGDLVLGTASV